jgi:ubiquinol-cytochrome c reductase iron-sulfur subunit
MSLTAHAPGGDHADDASKRDFLKMAAAASATIGVGAMAWPMIDSMNPSADVLALSSVEFDVAPIPVGSAITVVWRGKPVFVRHRSPAEIASAQGVKQSDLGDPATDADRVKKGKEQWLVVVGICTHLGCVPLGNKPTEARGEFGGWFCPCHGSQYDTSGRMRRGPAPLNLPVPPYAFLTDTKIKIG